MAAGSRVWLIGGGAAIAVAAVGAVAFVALRPATPPAQDAAAAASAVAAAAAAATDAAATASAAPAPAAEAVPQVAAASTPAPPTPPATPPTPTVEVTSQPAQTLAASVATAPPPAPPPAVEPPPQVAAAQPAPVSALAAPPPSADAAPATPEAAQAPTPPPSTTADTATDAGAAAPSAPAPVAMIPVAPAVLRQTVADAISPLGCALVGGDVAESGQITLRGVIGAGGAALLHGMVQDAAPTATTNWQVAMSPAAYCRVLDAVRPYAEPFGVTSDLDISLRSGDRPLRKEEFIVPVVTAPGFAGALSLDYFSSDGTLAHLHFDGGKTAVLPPGQTISVGDPAAADPTANLPAAGVPGWQADEPFGTDLLLAVVAEKPLFAKPRPDTDSVDQYLRDLQAALAAADRRGERIAIRAIPVRTVER